MVPYYFNVERGDPYSSGAFREETGSPFLRHHGARQSAPWIISECETDLVAHNREIAQLSFSSVTRFRLCCTLSATARSLAGAAQ